MTNEYKYKTNYEREMAFYSFCGNQSRCSTCTAKATPPESCKIVWLRLESGDEDKDIIHEVKEENKP